MSPGSCPSWPRRKRQAGQRPPAAPSHDVRCGRAGQGWRGPGNGSWLLFLALLSVCFFSANAFAERRFPPPDFESGYTLPATPMPPARALALEYADVAVLITALGLAGFLVYKRRSRQAVVTLSIFSLAYFGFYRQGCVCAIGSIGDVTVALFDRGYAVPLTILAFFIAPLVATLFVGRTFCAAVCPHGALQDLVLLRPLKVPPWLEEALGVLAYVYLGAAVLFAATGTDLIICRYDPFVPIFRRTGSFAMLTLGGVFLLIGVFVGRPYCRFLCPYGALLRLAATVSKWRVTVTPDRCTQCRLCEGSCPFGAIREPAPAAHPPDGLVVARMRLAGFLGLIPVFMIGGGWLGSKLAVAGSRVDRAVGVAERLVTDTNFQASADSNAAADLALARAQQGPREVVAGALEIRHRFVAGGWLFGAWVGLVIGGKLVHGSLWRKQTDFEPDRGRCFACARCFESCPQERVRRAPVPAAAVLSNAPDNLLSGATSWSNPGAVPPPELPARSG